MNKLYPTLVLLPLLAAACASKEPALAPDPAQVERLVASLNSQVEAPVEAVLPEEKLAQADRLVGVIEKVEPKRIDPALAQNILAL